MSAVDAVVYEADGATVIARVASPLKIAALEEYDSPGGGSVTLWADDPQLAEYPNLLDDRNVVKVRVDGMPGVAFLIKRREYDVVTGDVDAGRTVTASGPSLDAWLSEALVYANQQHPYSGSTRWFSYGSPEGDWYRETEWGTPSISRQLIPPQWYAPDNPWRQGPTNWPRQDTPAAWIWATGDSWRSAPVGDCYFRRTFTTPTGGRDYRLFVTADDACQILLDGQPLATVYDSGAYQHAYSVDFTLDAGDHVLAAKVRNLAGAAGFLAHLFAVARAGTDEDQLFHVARTGDEGWTICAYPRREPGWTFGGVLSTLVTEAQARGVAGLSNLTGLSFDADADSDGVPWGRRFYRFSVGDTITSVCDQEADYGVRVHVDPDTLELHAYNGRRGQPARVQLDAPVNVESLAESTESELSTALLVRTDSQWGGAAATSPYGRIESYLDVSGLSPADAADLSRAVLERSRIPTESVKVAYTPTGSDVPWQHLAVGDAVRVPSAAGYRARLVVGLSVALDDNGEARFEIELDSANRDLLERLARRMQRGPDAGQAAGKVQPRPAGSTLDDPVGGGLPGGALPSDDWPGLDDAPDPDYPQPGDDDWPGDPTDPDNPNFPNPSRPDAEWPADAPADGEHGRFDPDGIWHEGSSGGWYDSDGNWHTGAPGGWVDETDTWRGAAERADGYFDEYGIWHETNPDGWTDTDGVVRSGHPGGWYDSDDVFREGAQPGEGTLSSDGRWRQNGATWTDGDGNPRDGSPGGWWDSSGRWHIGARPSEGSFDSERRWTQDGPEWTDKDGGTHDGSPGGWFDENGDWHPGVDGVTRDDEGNFSESAGEGFYNEEGVWSPLEGSDYPQQGAYGVPGDPGNVGPGVDYEPPGGGLGGEPGPLTGIGGDPAWSGDPDLSGGGFIDASPVLDPPEGSDPWAPPTDPTGNDEGRWDVGNVSTDVAKDAIALWEGYAEAMGVALLTAEPDRVEGVWQPLESVEVSGEGYERQEIPWTSFGAATGAAPVYRESTADVTFGPNSSGASWQMVTHIALIVGTAIRSVIPLATPVEVKADMSLTIPAGGLQVAADSVAA